ncbi:MAG: choice-of-anchor D domain-containing protein [Acidobacteriaceae bacterium]
MSATRGCNAACASAICRRAFDRTPKNCTLLVLALLALLCGMGASAHAQTAAFIGSTSAIDATDFTGPQGITTDASGNVFVADALKQAVYEMMRTGPGAYSAPVALPSPASGYVYLRGVAIDSNGNLWVADFANCPSTPGQVYELVYNSTSKTFANPVKVGTSWDAPWAITADASGNVFVTDNGANSISEISNGTVTVVNTSGVTAPRGIAVNSSEDLFVIDGNLDRVMELTPPYTTAASVNNTEFQDPGDIALDASGNIWVAESSANEVGELTFASNYATVLTWGSRLNRPVSVWPDADGTLLVSDYNNGAIDQIATQGVNLGTVAVGSASPTQTLTFSFTGAANTAIQAPLVVTQGATGLDFADAGTGTCTTRNGAGNLYPPGATCTVNVTFKPKYPGARYGAVELLNSSGTMLAAALIYGTGQGAQLTFQPGSQSTVASDVAFPEGVAVDGSGNVYFPSSSQPYQLFRATPSNGSYVLSVVPTSALVDPSGVAVDGAGNVYLADSGNFRVLKETVTATGYAESTVATFPDVDTAAPIGVAVDGSGNVYVSLGAEAGIVYKESPTASGYVQSTVVSGLPADAGIAVDGSGNVYVAVDLTNGWIVKATPSASGYTQSTIPVSGDGVPFAVAVDASGSVYVAFTYSKDAGAVFRETPENGSYTQTTIATNGVGEAFGVALDSGGNVYVGDYYNDRIVKETLAVPPSLSFAATHIGLQSSDYPQTMTLSNIGNESLIFPVPRTGGNPSISANFTLDGLTTCPEVTTSSSAGTLAAGITCTLAVDFNPTVTGQISGSVVLTDNNMNASPSATQSIGLAGTGLSPKLTPAVTLTPSSSTIDTSQGLSVTVAVSGGSGNPVPAGSVSLSGPGYTSLATLTSGSASFNLPVGALAIGTDTLTASYSGDSNYGPATGSAVVTVTKTTPALFASANPASITTLQSTVIGAWVSSPQEANGGITVSLAGVTLGSKVLGGGILPGGITIPGTALPLGTDTLTVSYSGDDLYSAVSTTTTVTVSAPDYPVYPAQSAQNLGAINLGSTSSTPISIAFNATETVGSTAVVTQGAQGLDFTNAGGGTCDTNGSGHVYNAGDTCTVNVTFTPKYAGARYGAVQLLDTSGKLLALALVYGTGVGPQLVFPSNMALQTLGGGLGASADVAVDGSGNVYVADDSNYAIWKIPPGCVSASCMTTVGGGFSQIDGVAVDGNGNVYVADYLGSGEVKEMSPQCDSAGCVATLGSGFNELRGMAVDGSGNVYVSVSANNAVTEIPLGCASSSCVTALGGGFSNPSGVAVDGSGNVYIADTGNNAVKKMPPGCASSSCVTTLGGGFSNPAGVAMDGSGNVYVADQGNNAVKEMALNCASSSCVTTLSGGFSDPTGVALDGRGNVYVADSGNSLVEQLNLATPPSLSFANTTVGSQSSDSPQTVTLRNIGNEPLTFPVPGTGTNPSVSANFTLDSSTTCPELTTSSPAGTLTAGASCNLAVDFIPTTTGSISGSAVLTDNNLNASPSATQSIALSGVGSGPIDPWIQVNGGVWQEAASVSVNLGDTVNLGPHPVSDGSWIWTGPNGFTSTARVLYSIPLAPGTNTYTATYTNTAGAQSTPQAFTITVTTAVVPYIQVNGGAWTEESAASVNLGDTVNLGPHPVSGGSWSWSGPNGYTSTSRVLYGIPLTGGTDTYTATYTNTSGGQSTLAFTVTVNTPVDPWIQVNGGAWQEVSSVTVAAGTTVNLGPHPVSGGSWSWSGPNGYTSTSRVLYSVPLPSGTNTYTATYTNTAGGQSTLAFTITVN